MDVGGEYQQGHEYGRQLRNPNRQYEPNRQEHVCLDARMQSAGDIQAALQQVIYPAEMPTTAVEQEAVDRQNEGRDEHRLQRNVDSKLSARREELVANQREERGLINPGQDHNL